MAMRSPQEIEKQMYKAQEWNNASETDVSSMSYEEGVENALRWVLGEEDEAPIENEYQEPEPDDEG